MQNSTAVLQRKLKPGLHTVLNGVEIGILAHNLLHRVRADLLYQRGDILIVIIKGVAVNAADIRDILHGNPAEGALVQQLQKRRLDRPFCYTCICHCNPPFLCIYHTH